MWNNIIDIQILLLKLFEIHVLVFGSFLVPYSKTIGTKKIQPPFKVVITLMKNSTKMNQSHKHQVISSVYRYDDADVSAIPLYM